MSADPIWKPTPEAIQASQLTEFTRFCEQRLRRPLATWQDLYRFSVEEHERFWSLFVQWAAPIVEGDASPVQVGGEGGGVEQAAFFPGVRLSYVENILHSTSAEEGARLAVIGRDESGRSVRWTRAELARDVLAAAASLQRSGLVAPGHRVVAIASNTPEAVIACLACLALGASWSAIAPDLGAPAMLDRFRQLEPSVLFCHATSRQHGATRSVRDRIAALVDAIPSLGAVVSLDGEPLEEGGSAWARRARSLTLSALVEGGRAEPLVPERLPRFPFDHPLFILFSSGTTGAPKCIVHGAGGTLLEHLKEHRLHGDLRPADRLYFQTSCGWMMWNWQLSALAVGATILVYDGSVSFPEMDSLWRVVEEERVTVFGTSPAYLQFCRDAGLVPRELADLGALRAMQSTGSVLVDAHYGWVKENVKDVPLQSISGGTDIIGCFLLGNPNLPVYPGEMQSVGLALDVRALRPDGTAVGALEAREPVIGELVCARPFPSRPVGLHGDPDGRRFHEAYFSQNAGFWTHGDVLELTAHGTARIHGRSDGILNVRGIRIGPAEIYKAIESIDAVAEAMAIEQASPAEPGGTRLVLLVVMRPGATLDRPLTLRIKKELAQRCSMAHVPGAIAAVAELPMTHNGKRSERAARDALNRRPLANLGALKNPDCLRAIAEHPDLALE